MAEMGDVYKRQGHHEDEPVDDHVGHRKHALELLLVALLAKRRLRLRVLLRVLFGLDLPAGFAVRRRGFALSVFGHAHGSFRSGSLRARERTPSDPL